MPFKPLTQSADGLVWHSAQFIGIHVATSLGTVSSFMRNQQASPAWVAVGGLLVVQESVAHGSVETAAGRQVRSSACQSRRREPEDARSTR